MLTSHKAYDPIVTGDTSGWTLRLPTSQTTVMSGTGNLVSITRYDAQGRVIETRMPANTGGGDAHSTLSTYYSATGTGGCVNAAEAGLLCQTAPAAQPTSGPNLLTTTTTYNMWGAPLTVSETNGTGPRTTTTLYDPAQRECVHSITTSGAGDTTLPAVYTAYDPNTGLVIQTGNISGSTPTSCPSSPPTMSSWVSTGYDSDGRVSTYMDASNNLSSVTYTADGLTATLNDGKGSVTYTYDGVSGEHRRLLTSLVDGQAGTFSATYDANGALTSQTYPSGLVATRHLDDVGQTRSLAYVMGSTTWLSFSASYSAHGQILAQSSNGSSQLFSYDNAGRLTQVADTDQTVSPIACTTRIYAYDADTNRLSLTAYPGSSPGVCSTSTTPTVSSHTYDQADRISSPGYSYDPLGRTTAVPAADAGGSNALSVGYYVNDMVASQVQGTSSKSFGLDPTERLATITTGASVQTNRYADPSDSPAWISLSDGSWTRNVQDIAGNLGAIVSSTGTDELQLTNLHGDVVATVPNQSNAAGIDAYFESTEFGLPRSSNTTNPRYAWLGGKRRDSGDALAGIVLMGVRLYSPTLGRFLQVDPVPGGSANDYDYVYQDPINRSDLAGTFDFWGGLQSGMVAIGRALPGGARGAYGSAVAGAGSWAGQEHADLTSGDPRRQGMAAFQVVWVVSMVVPGPGAGAKLAAWAFRARIIGARSRLFGDVYSGASRAGLLDRFGARWAIGWSGKRVMVNGVKQARTVFRIKTPWKPYIDLFDGPYRPS
jgi:RHS repeat-associated protein